VTPAARFNTAPLDVECRVRPAAYAVIVRADGRVAAVRENEGIYLPGGGREAGETAEQNVAREIAEEIGRRPRTLRRLGEAVEFFHSTVDGCWYELQATFFHAELTDEVLPSPQLELFWVDPGDERSRFLRASHRWAVERAVEVASLR
jgi:8-oxo-dGTP diphosphatase